MKIKKWVLILYNRNQQWATDEKQQVRFGLGEFIFFLKRKKVDSGIDRHKF